MKKKSLEEIVLDFASDTKIFQINDLKIFLENRYSRQYLSKVLSGYVKRGVLYRSGTNINTFYTLPENSEEFSNSISKKFKNVHLREDRVLDKIRNEFFFKEKIKENVKSIFDYAFSEMLNNAIEHSQSKNISVQVSIEDGKLVFGIRDYGIGVFRNVMGKFKLKNELEAIQEILKGKTTTMPQAHSGQGIFFTSKVADLFILNSYGYSLTVDNDIQDNFFEKVDEKVRGTLVIFEIHLKSEKHLSELFKDFQTNNSLEFDKTLVTVKLYSYGTVHVSRSQARRILTNLTKFKHIVFDFKDVPTVGQAFADEVFRVFHKNNPHIVLETINANEVVNFMIDRVDK